MVDRTECAMWLYAVVFVVSSGELIKRCAPTRYVSLSCTIEVTYPAPFQQLCLYTATHTFIPFDPLSISHVSR